ncbi:hypothetical protein ACFL1R_04665 [Candidatus Latescibacterota bacterium]
MDFQVERIFKGPGFAETLYLGRRGGQRIIRKASNPDALAFSRTALVREIRLLQNLNEQLKLFFPEMLLTNLEDQSEDSPDLPDVIYYDMPYYPPGDGWVTLSDLLLDDSCNPAEAKKILGEILDTAFLYFRLDARKPDADYTEKTMLSAIRNSLSWARSDADFRQLISLKNMQLSGKPVRNVCEVEKYFHDTPRMRDFLTPHRDRFLHGDFFPENILYNRNTGRWILLDPVSVRGVHRGDFILDLNKMEDWLTGELPALRMGQFKIAVTGNNVDYAIFNRAGKLGNLHRLGLSEWYRDRLKKAGYADLFKEEKGWELRWFFVKAFYALCMLPLADREQAIARYFLALKAMNDFIESV